MSDERTVAQRIVRAKQRFRDEGLCNQALRLARLLTATKRTAIPTAFALRALLCFHASRLPARLADDGSLLLMPEQDRSRWDRALMAEAFSSLELAGSGDELSRFHVEAAIAACHAMGSTWATTDWLRIVELYDLLRAQVPSLVVDVNRAVAIAPRSVPGVSFARGDKVAFPAANVGGSEPNQEPVKHQPRAMDASTDVLWRRLQDGGHLANGQLD